MNQLYSAMEPFISDHMNKFSVPHVELVLESSLWIIRKCVPSLNYCMEEVASVDPVVATLILPSCGIGFPWYHLCGRAL